MVFLQFIIVVVIALVVNFSDSAFLDNHFGY